MGVYRLSALCDQDLAKIYEFGIDQFGLRLAEKYIMGLHESFESLAQHSYIGINASELIPELRRLTFKSHMIFYFIADYGVHIIRVLHQSMDYQRRFLK
jgi:toxin ParE1/3/4